ncbi:MAG TPA: hypothetical protein VE957_21610 [Terriglobales bacterium]|nr:hypothetical protein [Terriglobales bacterium]
MEPEYSIIKNRSAFPIEAGATVKASKNSQTIHATTVNMSAGDVLLHFEEPVQLAVGDQVACEFRVAHEAGSPLPYWGLGNVVRAEDCRVAVVLKAGDFSPLESETDAAASARI